MLQRDPTLKRLRGRSLSGTGRTSFQIQIDRPSCFLTGHLWTVPACCLIRILTLTIRIRNTHLSNRYNNKVFIAPPWQEIYRNDAERDQSFEQSIEVFQRLENWYEEHDYDIVILPKDTIENRVKFILAQVAN